MFHFKRRQTLRKMKWKPIVCIYGHSRKCTRTKALNPLLKLRTCWFIACVMIFYQRKKEQSNTCIDAPIGSSVLEIVVNFPRGNEIVLNKVGCSLFPMCSALYTNRRKWNGGWKVFVRSVSLQSDQCRVKWTINRLVVFSSFFSLN